MWVNVWLSLVWLFYLLMKDKKLWYFRLNCVNHFNMGWCFITVRCISIHNSFCHITITHMNSFLWVFMWWYKTSPWFLIFFFLTYKNQKVLQSCIFSLPYHYTPKNSSAAKCFQFSHPASKVLEQPFTAVASRNWRFAWMKVNKVSPV